MVSLISGNWQPGCWITTVFVIGRLGVGGTMGQNTFWQHQHDPWAATLFLKLEFSGWTTVISGCPCPGNVWVWGIITGLPFTILPRLLLSTVLVDLFRPHFSFPANFAVMCLDTAPFFSHDLLCLTLLVWGVSDHLLNNHQDCSHPHDCVAPLNEAERPLEAQETFADVSGSLANWRVIP